LQLLNEHLGFGIHVIMNLNFLEEIWAKCRITHKKVLVECRAMVLLDLLHHLYHPLFELDGKAFTFQGGLLIV
jgi:hypothetical protein